MVEFARYFVLVTGVIFLPVLAAQEGGDGVCKVVLQNGTVTGTLTGTLNPDKKICSFMAIPYAAAPVEGLRFKEPQTYPKNWGELNATQIPNWCPQKEKPPSGVNVSEDCLYLNVYQPQNVSQVDPAGLPVMIWLHGGAFVTGSSFTYTPTKLLARGDVILVVVHYRLGMLGFFSTGDATVPGNNGLKDQAFSIRWVNENIKAFNGNPNNVTIFGESAGAASVVYQYISPLNKGLIKGAIAQSGTALTSWAVDRNPRESAKIMAKRLGCPTIIDPLMVECLRQVPWEKIIQEQGDYSNECYKNMTYAYATVSPVVEPKDVPGAFISEEPAVIMKNGDIPDIPLMTGANKHDGSFLLTILFGAKFFPEGLASNPDYMKNQIVPDLLKFSNVPELDPGNRAVQSSVELAYLGGVNRSDWMESMPGLVDLMSVFAFKSAAQNTAELLSARNRSVYLYSFEHHSVNTLQPWTLEQVPIGPGIGHADDLIYLFNLPSKFSNDDQSFSDMMIDMWLNFAKTGNPTPDSDDKRFETWIPYNSLDEPYLKLNVTPTMQLGYRDSWRPNGFEWN